MAVFHSSLEKIVLSLRRGEDVERNSRRIFERLYPTVVAFFRKKGYEYEECQDLAQEVLVRVFSGLSGFRGDSKVSTWVYSIARNAHRNRCRWRGSAKRNAVEESIDQAQDADSLQCSALGGSAATVPQPLEQLLEDERFERLDKELGRLPPQMRRCLELRVIQELKYKDIARLLQISIGTVKSHLHAARKRLERQLGSDFDRSRF